MTRPDDDDRYPAWDLLDGDEQHRRDPRTFAMPPADDRLTLRPGDVVKVGLIVPEDLLDEEDAIGGERPWLTILDRDGEGADVRYLAEAGHAFLFALDEGDTIEIRPCHVLDLKRRT